MKTWSLKRTQNYGSRHYNEKELRVDAATVSSDGESVFLAVPDIEKTWCMEIKYELMSADGMPVAQRIHNTIHHLAAPDSPGAETLIRRAGAVGAMDSCSPGSVSIVLARRPSGTRISD